MSRIQHENASASRPSIQREEEVRVRFERELNEGRQPRIEDYLQALPEPERATLLRDLLLLELAHRRKSGETPRAEEYRQRFTERGEVILEVFARCAAQRESSRQDSNTETIAVDEPQPQRLGRYRITAKLGRGTFGIVYQAYDDDLDLERAIKVPHRHLLDQPQIVESYLEEARKLARLDHANIVKVFDFGRTDEGLCYIVSQWIQGGDLAERMRVARPSLLKGAELVAATAEALHYAHRNRLVHRDVKPANILIDLEDKPYLADFGLALREEDFGRAANFAGTVPYMSPEQARGEGHRVDGRSDIFSLGIVLYELLTGRRPFRGETYSEILEQILSVEPRPPRQIDDAIPRELERICLKALAKRASERYTTASDLAEDLSKFLQNTQVAEAPAVRAPLPTPSVAPSTVPNPPSSPPASHSASQAIRIVPKGLRSFDAHDADFFLELIPGPRDREGLPDSLRFWKTRVEETDPENTFSVGLLYGPSGCGKSSLVKAGLLPRLSPSVIAIYLEASAAETETRLLNGIRKRCPTLPAGLGLKDALGALRRGQGIAEGKKVLIVLDQFEQWLHAGKGENAELVQALRQCDGGRVQCLVMVRDDFWLAVSRFMAELEVELVQGRNMSLVDLFDPRHAKRVLMAFGRAFGALPEHGESRTPDQEAFLDHAIKELSQNGKIIPVRLSLFAEMVKGKPWTAATLKAIGGMEGVGVTFLEETFTATTAPPQHRVHQRAAQAVLKELLPDTGTDIKGNMCSYADLLTASLYSNRQKEFDALLHSLDEQLRLITPTDPEGADAEDRTVRADPHERYYQLTHDYLVHSLRDWLNRKEKETIPGRAKLRLKERAAAWNAKPENRNLPAWWEWARIRLWTRSRGWTPPQRKMMGRADRYYLARLLAFTALLFVVAWGAWEYLGWLEAQSLYTHLLSARTSEVPGILDKVGQRRRWLTPRLHEASAQLTDPKEKLHVSLALLRTDPGQVPYVYERLLFDVEPQYLSVVRGELAAYRSELIETLWGELANQAGDSERRLRAACALAEYAPSDSQWAEYSRFVADQLVAADALALRDWKNALEPASRSLRPALAASLEEDRWVAQQRRRLIELYEAFSSGEEAAFAPLEERLAARQGQAAAGVAEARRRANVAAALVALRRGDRVWQLLVHSEDPTLRSYLIERLGESGVNINTLKQRLDEEKDTSARRALLLTLGSLEPQAVRSPELERDLLALYENHPDAGIHAAAGWVLRKWKQGRQLRAIDVKLATAGVEKNRLWYLNKQGQTFSIIDGPRGLMQRVGKMRQASVHRFAIAATEVTVAQFRASKEGHPIAEGIETKLDSPVNMVSWYDAAEYCNWLSLQERIPDSQWCYRPNKEKKLEFVPDYQSCTGYRLPTENEWIFACRAGAQTLWSFGEADDELLGKYAWWVGNAHAGGERKCFPVGSLKPNDSGLFDMHGNLTELCQEPEKPEGRLVNDIECGGRGGCYFSVARAIAWDRPSVVGRTMTVAHIGFRPVRTMP